MASSIGRPDPVAEATSRRSVSPAPSPLTASISGASVVGWALVLLAAKLSLIGAYGNNTPFWDQWDAQGAYLYSPWLAGHLPLDVFVSAHNEHRILFTRILALVLLEVNGLWSPLLEMCVNALLHVLAVVSAAVLLGRAAGTRAAPALLLASAVLILCIPFGWENTLAGFQSQFYFVLLFSVWALWMLHSPAFSRRWWAGVVLCVFAYFSLASGLMAVAAAAAMVLLRLAVGGGRRRDLAALFVLIAVTAAFYIATPVVPGHAPLRATTLWQVFDATLSGLSWPFYRDEMALVRNAPLFVLACVLVRQRSDWADPRWYIVALGVWSMLQSVALAYGRTHDMYASRYLDLHAMALLVNAAALLAIAVPALQSRHRRAAFAALAAWCFVSVLGCEQLAGNRFLRRTLEVKREMSERQQRNLAEFLRTRDLARLARHRSFEVPYPDAKRLALITADPRLVAMLPGELQPAPPGSVPAGRLNGLVTWLFEHWLWLLQTGLALVGVAIVRASLPALLAQRPARWGGVRQAPRRSSAA